MIGIFYIDINIHGAVVVCGDIGTRQYYGYTKSQVENLLEFFEINFIDSIRNDEGIDNIEYLCNMCDVYQKLKECVRGADNV